MTVYGNNFQTGFAKKVIAGDLAEICQLMHLMISPKLHMLMVTCKMQWVPVVKKTLSYLSTFLKQKAWKFSIVSVSWRLHHGWLAAEGKFWNLGPPDWLKMAFLKANWGNKSSKNNAYQPQLLPTLSKEGEFSYSKMTNLV